MIEALGKGDLGVFGPGIFYTSILPQLQIKGIAEALSAAQSPHVWIGNILQCRETLSMGLADFLLTMSTLWKASGLAEKPSSRMSSPTKCSSLSRRRSARFPISRTRLPARLLQPRSWANTKKLGSGGSMMATRSPKPFTFQAAGDQGSPTAPRSFRRRQGKHWRSRLP
ncbi:hypothetical protein GOD41_08510 [Sinorhizobium medicae]|nr:hypothetical protein [Sinorhizobium medicae]